MRRMLPFLRTMIVPVALGFCVSGCALGRSVIDVNVPEPTTSVDSAQIVKITEVHDLRKFEVNPKDPSQPSLGSDTDILDSKITSHAIGRKRGGYGNALGDLALPEGKTVASIVKEAARTAFQERGYKVVDEGSPDYSIAMPVALDVNQFWAWMKPGFVELTLSLESQVTIKGKSVVEPDPAVVIGHYSMGSGAAFESTWTEMIHAGMADLIQKMELRIKSRPDSGGTAPQAHAAISPGS